MSKRQRVLAIDDERAIHGLMQAALSPVYDVAVAPNGEEGLRMALASAPDIVLTDLKMPGMSGQELLHRLRQERSLEEVPVVVLTGQEDASVRLDLLRAGAQDFLVKPFSIEELRVRIANLLRMKLARDLLQQELQSRERDVGVLVAEVMERRAALQTALEAAKQARDRAESADRAKTRFLSLVSHELRTPLTVLMLTVDAWLRPGRAPGPGTDAEGSRMKGALGRLKSIVDNVIEYTNLEAGRQRPHLEAVDMAALIGDLVDLFQETLASKGLRVDIQVAAEAKQVTIDSHAVSVILTNLIENAVRYTDAGGIAVQASVDDGLVLAVSDSGRGIDARECERIFHPFEQVEPMEYKSTPGIGLGLTLVRELAAAAGGRVTVQSSKGAGSTFTVRIPTHHLRASS